jgi:hypothetical protein
VVTGMQMPQFISSLGVTLLAKEKHFLNLEKKLLLQACFLEVMNAILL